MDSQKPPEQKQIDFAGCAGGVESLGPGKRTVMWVRGCSLACPGCMTPELWASGTKGSLKSIEAVAAILYPLLLDSDGLTISGGEPMEQPAALAALVRHLRKAFPNLEVLVYSGYNLGELKTQGQPTLDFLGEIDILIDSRFIQSATNDLKWRGSDNQRVHYLSERAQKHAPNSDDNNTDDKMPEARLLQIQMMESGLFRIIGIPKRGDMIRYRRLMAARGIKVAKIQTG